MKNVHDESQANAAMVDEIRNLLEKLNESTQDMSATTEQMAAGMEETAASTVNLQNISDKLKGFHRENSQGGQAEPELH